MEKKTKSHPVFLYGRREALSTVEGELSPEFSNYGEMRVLNLTDDGRFSLLADCKLLINVLTLCCYRPNGGGGVDTLDQNFAIFIHT